MQRLSKKNNHSFHLGSAHVYFLRTRRTFRVPFRTLPFGLGIVVDHPWFIACYYFIQKIWLNFESFQKILTNFQQVRFLLRRQIFRLCKWSVRILWTAFLSNPVSSAIILTFIRRSFAITARTTSTFWLFVDEIGLPERRSWSTFSRPSLKALCHLKTTVLDRVGTTVRYFPASQT